MNENKMAMIGHMRMMGMPLTKELVDYLYETVKEQQKEITTLKENATIKMQLIESVFMNIL
ncbi:MULTISPECIES: hypothetical protein [Bacillota]|uniref:hypothetical protein n=1 Tax=Bacillota TaxID=1239 RepID=UPI0003102CF7|nr:MULTISPECIES: hypothetical protein [Bacillota]NRG29477.1 hypothetical protein [Niallia circulans]